MHTLKEFVDNAANQDFQRTNLFSVVFATSPSNKTQALLDKFGGYLYENIPSGVNDLFGLTRSDATDAFTNVAIAGTQMMIRKSGVSKYLIGAMSNRVVQTLLGEIEVGTQLIDFFNMAYPQSGLMVYSVKVPENRLAYEMDKNHNAPNVKITGRDHDPLILSFRMDSSAANYRAMNDWVNSVEDPVTGLRALPIDVEADIQVNLHNRNGIPHTVAMFTGCIPVSVSSPELSYESNNEIMTFDVTFAYRVMQVGAVGEQAARDWIEDKLIYAIKSDDNPLTSAGKALSRLEGVGGRVVNDTLVKYFQ